MREMKCTDIPEHLSAVSTMLHRAGVQATINNSRIRVPGAWVTFDEIVPDTLDGDVTVTGIVYLVARDNGHVAAMTTLFSMLAIVLNEIPSVTECSADTVALPGTMEQLPCIKVEFDL